MGRESGIYVMPNLGCMLGTAYQILVSRLGEILEEKSLEITVPEYLILRALYTRNGMQQCEIGEMIGKDKGAISRSVKTMVTKGLVRTESISHKCLKVYLTERGEKIKIDIMNIAESRHEALLSLLTKNEITSLESALKKIIDSNKC